MIFKKILVFANSSALLKLKILLKPNTVVLLLNMLSTLRKKSTECDICFKTYSDRRSLKKHKKNVHKIFAQSEEFTCTDCMVKETSLLKITRHLEAVHGAKLSRACIYCHLIFTRESAYVQHMEHVHSLPVWNRENLDTAPPTETAFNGAIKTYDLYPTMYDIDLLEYITRNRAEIEEIVGHNTMHNAQKMQLTIMVSLSKPGSSPDEEREKVTIHLNTKFYVIYQNGINDTVFQSCLEEMMLALMSFVGHGSGWTIDSLDKLTIKLVRFAPIRASSYLALPPELSGDSNLLNVRNREDEKCFEYCFTAAYHLKYGPKLWDQNHKGRARTNPNTYSRNNPIAHLPRGDYDMPMGLNRIDSFESLNRVQINIFR